MRIGFYLLRGEKGADGGDLQGGGAVMCGWSNVRSFWFNRQRTWQQQQHMASAVSTRLDWPLDTAGAFDDDFCVTVDSESFRAQATGNCIKIMKRTKKKKAKKR